jgi:alpha-glucosidase
MGRHDRPSTAEWWQTAVVYQVYPRSFQDSDGDGVGDLAGVVHRLDYLVDLGVDAIWLSPIYRSPMVDFGYDVTDHCDVDPIFGTLADVDRLIAAVHDRGVRLILDLIPSHTSDWHPWFLESRSDRDSPKRDWYLWRDPGPGGGPPNNWLSEFGGSAWTLDEQTDQYYYHAHLVEQPDLNWRNPDVAEAMLEVLRFWFERGVDGFRIDAVDQAVKDADFADNPPNPEWHDGRPPTERWLRLNQKDRPELHELVAARMRRVADEAGDRVLLSEAYLPLDRMMAYYGPGGDGFHLPFNFQLIGAPWEPRVLASLIEKCESLLPAGAWPTWVLGNHDRSRIASRVGRAQARIAAMLLLTLRGTPTIYYGDELGMRDVPIPLDRVQDPFERNLPGIGVGRDPVRTPMAWNGGPGAGFTTGEPWLPIDDDPELVVARQLQDSGSMLVLYRELLSVRRREAALTQGRYETVHVDDHVFVYARTHESRTLVIALNLTSEPAEAAGLGTTLLSTCEHPTSSAMVLGPDEGRITLR